MLGCWTGDLASLCYWDNFFGRHSRRRFCYYGKLITPLEVKKYHVNDCAIFFFIKEYGKAVTRLHCGKGMGQHYSNTQPRFNEVG